MSPAPPGATEGFGNLRAYFARFNTGGISEAQISLSASERGVQSGLENLLVGFLQDEAICNCSRRYPLSNLV